MYSDWLSTSIGIQKDENFNNQCEGQASDDKCIFPSAIWFLPIAETSIEILMQCIQSLMDVGEGQGKITIRNNEPSRRLPGGSKEGVLLAKVIELLNRMVGLIDHSPTKNQGGKRDIEDVGI